MATWTSSTIRAGVFLRSDLEPKRFSEQPLMEMLFLVVREILRDETVLAEFGKQPNACG